MSVNAFSSAALAKQLAGCFDLIAQKWKQHAPTDSHLWEISQQQSPCDILERDLCQIGMHFAAADALSIQAEMFLIAEYIVFIRQYFQAASSNTKMEREIEKVGAILIKQQEGAASKSGRIYAPLCYRMAQFAAVNGFISPETVAVLKESLIEIAYHFTLRDGNITPEEDLRLKEFHAALST